MKRNTLIVFLALWGLTSCQEEPHDRSVTIKLPGGAGQYDELRVAILPGHIDGLPGCASVYLDEADLKDIEGRSVALITVEDLSSNMRVEVGDLPAGAYTFMAIGLTQGSLPQGAGCTETRVPPGGWPEVTITLEEVLPWPDVPAPDGGLDGDGSEDSVDTRLDAERADRAPSDRGRDGDAQAGDTPAIEAGLDALEGDDRPPEGGDDGAIGGGDDGAILGGDDGPLTFPDADPTCPVPLVQADPARPPVGIWIDLGEDLLLSAQAEAPTSYLMELAWRLGDDVEARSARIDTNGDGRIDQDDADPALEISLPWEALSSLSHDVAIPVSLTVTTGCGSLAEDQTTLTITTGVVEAIAQAQPNPAACGQEVDLDGSESQTRFPKAQVAEHLWVGAEGPLGEGPLMSHAFDAFGRHPVALVVTDDLGHRGLDRLEVDVSLGNHAPQAVTGGPYELNPGQDLVLDASGSTDPDAPCGDSVVLAAWDLDGDGASDAWAGPELIVLVPASHVAALGLTPGLAHEISLHVEDSLGLGADSMTTLTMRASAGLEAAFTITPSPTGCRWEALLDGGASWVGPPRRITQWAWDLDQDGLHDEVTTTPLLRHAFPLFGTVNVTLTVTDDGDPPGSATTARSVEVTLGNHAPTANGGGPLFQRPGQPLMLDATRSHDPDGPCGDSLTYRWDLNQDGDFDLEGPLHELPWEEVLAWGLGQEADPETLQPAQTILIEAKDSFGLTDRHEVALIFLAQGPRAVASVSPPSGGCTTAFVFDGSGSSDQRAGHEIASFSWDLDLAVDSDGNGHGSDDEDSTAVSPTATYIWSPQGPAVAGAHRVGLTVLSDDGAWDRTEISVEVELPPNRPPVADAGGPYLVGTSGGQAVPVDLDGTRSRDPDAPCDGITSYEWDIDLDGSPDLFGPRIEELLDPAWEPGQTVEVRLRVADSHRVYSPWDAAQVVVASLPTTSVQILSPNGGEMLKGRVWIESSLQDSAGATLSLVAYVNDVPVGSALVDTPDDGSPSHCLAGSPCAIALDTTLLPHGLGAYTLLLQAQGGAGGTAEDQSDGPFGVDNTPPTLVLAATTRAEQASLEGTAVDLAPLAVDSLDPQPVVVIEPPMLLFPLGMTSLLVTARDWAGNQTSQAATVEIVDTTAPLVSAGPDLELEAQSPDGTPVPLAPTAQDLCDTAPVITLWSCHEGCLPFSGLAPLGETEVTVRAIDASGNVGEDSVMITVVDTTGPTIDLPQLRVEVEAPGETGVAFEAVPLPVPILSDNGYPRAELEWEIVSPPVRFLLGETSVQYRAWDPAGNSTWAEVTVAVTRSI